MKTKKQRRKASLLLIVALLFMFGFVSPLPMAQAVDSIINAKDLITDSDPGATGVRHEFTFDTTTSTPATGYIEMVFADEFGDIAAAGNVICGAGWTGTRPSVTTARCAADGLEAAGTKSFMVTNVQNPDPGQTPTSYTIEVSHYNASAVLMERVTLRVAIIQDVLITAKVSSALVFTVSGTTTGAIVNGETCDVTSTATSVPFGTLDFNPRTVCQDLSVQTNAEDGFTVTVWEDNEMRSDSGANINSFDNSPNGTGSSTPADYHTWVAPANLLDVDHTYGHMGITSNDTSLTGSTDPFGGTKYAGFTGTSSIEVMYHDGPTKGTDLNRGWNSVAYTIEIDSLQEAGDYENTVTYIATAQY